MDRVLRPQGAGKSQGGARADAAGQDRARAHLPPGAGWEGVAGVPQTFLAPGPEAERDQGSGR